MDKCFKLLITLVLLIGHYSQAYSQSLKVDSITFVKDYFPGTNDINGKYLGSTETMTIINHKGKMYAGMGNWMDYPITLQSEGAQVLRKNSYNSPWVVDTSLGYTSLRTDALQSIYFTKDYNGNNLTTPVNLLVGGFSRIVPPLNTSIWVRDDNINMWQRNIAGIFTNTNGLTGIRSFCVHTDKVTGKQWLFCGLASGSIIKAAYDPTALGFLQIDTAQEMDNLGRVVAMTVCDGNLYASAGVGINGNDTIGGLYRRIDGVNPTWELVYQWPYNPNNPDGDQNVMRGIRCIPNPDESNNNVIVGARNLSALIQIIEPFNNHNVYTELKITDFLADAWFGGGNWPYMNYSIAAYNDFTPDTINGEEVWWTSLAIEAPNQLNQPNNGAYFLLRYKNGTYKWGYVYDNSNPIPDGESLRATRTICKSPFPEDSSKIYYFGGYDCLGDTSNNTAWIYKGVIENFTVGISTVQNNLDGIRLYPNPSNTQITISNLPDYFKGTITIYNLTGQKIIQQSISDNRITINVNHLPSGVYYAVVRDEEKTFTTRKIVKD